MAEAKETEWYDIVEMVTPYVVRIETPQVSGTGFITINKDRQLYTVATAEHVIKHAHYWEEPIRLEHVKSGNILMLQKTERVVYSNPRKDIAAIFFEGKNLPIPSESLPLIPESQRLKQGVEIGWLGFPVIHSESLCFFSGRISAWIENEEAYLVDGVAINGVSGGPAFTIGKVLIGLVAAYFPNLATGVSLPGLSMVRGVNQYHKLAQTLATLEQAKARETPPTEPQPSIINELEKKTLK